MAGSRLEKLGTIFTRVRDLMRTGVIKESEKPIWYDIYAAFPPIKAPFYQAPSTRFYKAQDTVTSVLYEEDTIRAKFFKVYGTGPRPFDLSRSNFKSTSHRFVEKFQELKKLGETDEDILFEEAGKALLAEGLILRRKGGDPVGQVTGSLDPVLQINLKDMLEEMQEQQQYQETDVQKEALPHTNNSP